MEHNVFIVLEVAMRTFTTGSLLREISLGKKNEAKSAGLIPSSSKDRHI